MRRESTKGTKPRFPQQARIDKFLAALRRELPDLRPNEDDDFTWADEGHEMIANEDYLMAERRFQELILSQPEHYDGYEGLALVCQALGRRREAVLLIDYAVYLCQEYVRQDWADQEVLDELLAGQKAIHEM